MFSLPPFYLSCYNSPRLYDKYKKCAGYRVDQYHPHTPNSSGYASITMPRGVVHNLLSETIKI